MKSITKIYSKNGAYLEDVEGFDFGTLVASSSKDPQIISFHADDVSRISSISLKIAASQNFDLDEGFIQYYTSRQILTSFDNINKKTLYDGDSIPVRTVGTADTEYVYLWVNPNRTTYRGNAFFRFEWKFDYIEPSSSSSSSSSFIYGDYYVVGPFEDRKFFVSDCELVYIKFTLGLSDYCTVFFDGDPFVVENNGDTLIINDMPFYNDNTCMEINVNGNEYSVCVIDSLNFMVQFYRIGDCTIADHLLLTTSYDFLLTDSGRVLLLDGTIKPPDNLLLTTGDSLLLVDGSRFLILGSS